SSRTIAAHGCNTRRLAMRFTNVVLQGAFWEELVTQFLLNAVEYRTNSGPFDDDEIANPTAPAAILSLTTHQRIFNMNYVDASESVCPVPSYGDGCSIGFAALRDPSIHTRADSDRKTTTPTVRLSVKRIPAVWSHDGKGQPVIFAER